MVSHSGEIKLLIIRGSASMKIRKFIAWTWIYHVFDKGISDNESYLVQPNPQATRIVRMAIDQENINHGLRFDAVVISGNGGHREVLGGRVPDSGSGHCREQGHARDPGRGAEVRADRRSRFDLRGAGYGKEPDRLRSPSPKPPRRPVPSCMSLAAGFASRTWPRSFSAAASTARSETTQRQLPLVEEARGGTLFLEDVAQLPLWGQVRLLEILQQRAPFPRRRTCGRGSRRAGDRVEHGGPVRRHGAAGFPVEPVLLPQGRRDPRSAAAASLPKILVPSRKATWRSPTPRGRAKAAGPPATSPKRPCSASWSTTGPATSCNWRVSSPMRPC